MYLGVDIFDHDLHMAKTGGNAQCFQCHADKTLPKVRENTTKCLECHQGMVQQGARVTASSPNINSLTVGYMDALHGLCITCHKEVQDSTGLPDDFSRCARCHQLLPDITDDAWRRNR